MKISDTMKARIRGILVSLTATTNRRMVVSAIIAGLGLLGIREISPESIDPYVAMAVNTILAFMN